MEDLMIREVSFDERSKRGIGMNYSLAGQIQRELAASGIWHMRRIKAARFIQMS
jgi:hypothetical protein